MNNGNLILKFQKWATEVSNKKEDFKDKLFCRSALLSYCDDSGDGMIILGFKDTCTGKREVFNFSLDLTECYIGDIVRVEGVQSDLFYVMNKEGENYTLISYLTSKTFKLNQGVKLALKSNMDNLLEENKLKN